MPHLTKVRLSMTETSYKIWGGYGKRFSQLRKLWCELGSDVDGETEEEINVSASDFKVVVQSILDWFPQVYKQQDDIIRLLFPKVNTLPNLDSLISILHLAHLIENLL